jgi:general secretion pathway protein J
MRIYRTDGFTLLEMVVAVAIFAVLAGIAYSGLNHTIKTGNQVSESNQRLSELQFALSYFSRDWLQVSSRKVRNQYGDEESNIIIEDNSISFTRSGWSNLLQRKRSNLQRVQYLVVDSKLVRRHWLSLDQGIGEEPFDSVMLHNVKNLEINFVDVAEKTIDNWPSELIQDDSSTPIALKIGVEIAQLGKTWRYLEIPDGAL